MKVILLRHASRSLTDFGDAPLSKTGHRQAAELARNVAFLRKLPAPTRLYASPKTRAKETLAPLGQAVGLTTTIDERFDERLNSESGRTFEMRVKSVLESLIQGLREDDVAFVCSHLDWLEVALRTLATDLADDTDPANWSNCEYRVFDVSEGFWSQSAHGIVLLED